MPAEGCPHRSSYRRLIRSVDRARRGVLRLMGMAPTLFRILLALVALYAFLRGSRDERYAGAIMIVGAAATHLAISPLRQRFGVVETPVMMVDIAVFAGFLWIALRSQRFWPMWIAGLQLTAILGHVMKLVDT